MRTFYYEFADGYFCYNAGRMSREDIVWEERKHGKLVSQKII